MGEIGRDRGGGRVRLEERDGGRGDIGREWDGGRGDNGRERGGGWLRMEERGMAGG